VLAQDPSGLIQTNVANPYRRGLVSGTLTRQQGKNNTIVLTASYENERQRNQGVGGVNLPTAGLDWSSIEQDTIYNQMTVVTPTLLNQIRVLAGNEYEYWDGLSQAQKIIVLDAFTGGGSQQDRARTEHHLTVTDVVSWTRGRHAMKFGFQIPDWSRRRFDDNTNRAGTFYFSSLADYTANRPYAFIQQAGNGHVVFLEKVLGAFAQDEVRLRPKCHQHFAGNRRMGAEQLRRTIASEGEFELTGRQAGRRNEQRDHQCAGVARSERTAANLHAARL